MIYSPLCWSKAWVNFFSSQNAAGVEEEKRVAVISQTIEVIGDQVEKRLQTACLK